MTQKQYENATIEGYIYNNEFYEIDCPNMDIDYLNKRELFQDVACDYLDHLNKKQQDYYCKNTTREQRIKLVLKWNKERQK